eukprot:9152813-Pyramimonas_sp.AAC.1
MPCDGPLDLMAPRQVDIACCDAASGNLRNERAFAEAFPRRSQLTLLRRAHKKYKVAEQGLIAIRPFDTNL